MAYTTSNYTATASGDSKATDPLGAHLNGASIKLGEHTTTIASHTSSINSHTVSIAANVSNISTNGTNVASNVTSIALRPVPLTQVAGRRYGPSNQSDESLTRQSAGSGTILYTPFLVTKAGTIDEIGAEVVIASGGSTFRVGLYADSSGVPGALLYGGGELTGASTGIKTDSSISLAVTPGWHWTAIRSSASGVQFRAISATSILPVLGSASALGDCPGMVAESGGYGAFPDPAGSAALNGNSVPIIFTTFA